MGLTQYVLNAVSPHVSKEMLPVAVFASLSLIAATTGSSWENLYAVAIPIVVPLAQHIGGNEMVNCGAVISSGVFGANACTYSDATVLTAQSTEGNNLDNSMAQLPYALIAFGELHLLFDIRVYDQLNFCVPGCSTNLLLRCVALLYCRTHLNDM